MKIILLTLLLIFINTTLFANKNWIAIEPINKTQTPKKNTQLDVNLSQIEPVSQIIKNATVIRQLFEATSKKEEPVTHKKNWYIIDNMENK